MIADHRIVVAPDGDTWRVAIIPPLPLGDEPIKLIDRDIAMARARLLRLRHGFPIEAPIVGRSVR